ncbi:MAG TPA: R3H domain-containing nucleic acid-binding protein [Solirubrobacterales bacterium]|nr:R3H domain-containing nucleic acid-binding protein [Solirubrobacterales bacterium]
MSEGGVESQPTVLPEEPAERVRVVLERIVEDLGLEASISVAEGDDEIHADIEGEDIGLLIGRHGQTIDAIQLIAYQAAFRGRQDRKRVSVDAAGYRRRQGESLRRRAEVAAEDALRHGQAVEMDPMGSNERRVVHEHLRDRPEIETYSEGDEPNRYVVVAPLLAG